MQIDNIKAIEEILDRCCPEKEADMCMLKGCNHCEAVYLHEHGVTVKVFGVWLSLAEKSPVLVETDGYVRRAVECSVCAQYLFGSGEYAVYGRFCPCCGAKMKQMRGETYGDQNLRNENAD